MVRPGNPSYTLWNDEKETQRMYHCVKFHGNKTGERAGRKERKNEELMEVVVDCGRATATCFSCDIIKQFSGRSVELIIKGPVCIPTAWNPIVLPLQVLLTSVLCCHFRGMS